MLELASGGRPGGRDEPDVALGAVGILYSSLKMLSPYLFLFFCFAFLIKSALGEGGVQKLFLER